MGKNSRAGLKLQSMHNHRQTKLTVMLLSVYKAASLHLNKTSQLAEETVSTHFKHGIYIINRECSYNGFIFDKTNKKRKRGRKKNMNYQSGKQKKQKNWSQTTFATDSI